MNEDFDEFEEEEEDDEHEEEFDSLVTIDVVGLSLYVSIGVTEAERNLGQRILIDLSLEIGECGALLTDRIEHTVDYAKVCEAVSLVAQQRSYKTLERLAGAIADRLMDVFAPETVSVKVTKTQAPLPLPVDRVSVELWRETH